MSADNSTKNDDEVKLAKFIRDSLRISENLSQNLKYCIERKSTKIRRLNSSIKNSQNSLKKKSKRSRKVKNSISGKRRLSKNSKNKKRGSKSTSDKSKEDRKSQIRRGLPTAFHGELKIGTSYDNGKPKISMRCNPRNIFNSCNDSSLGSDFENFNSDKSSKSCSRMSSTDTDKSKKSSSAKRTKNNKKNLKEKSSNEVSCKKNVKRNILKKTPHVFDPLNSEDTYPNIVRSPVTSSSVTSIIPYNNKKSQNKDLRKNENSYKEIPGPHVGYLIKNFKKNKKTGIDEAIFDIIFDLSINVDKNKKVIPLNIIANFATNKNPVVATNGIIFEQE
uniref:Uncharacterized protein n=1 Tax=Strongyloides stercoralis TaxID=6248 RepID=A0A0K0ERW7_STRER